MQVETEADEEEDWPKARGSAGGASPLVRAEYAWLSAANRGEPC